MAGAGWSQLKLRRRYDPSWEPSFETVAKCKRLDEEDANRFISLGQQEPHTASGRSLLELGHRLDYAARDESPPESRASRLFTREERRIAGSNTAGLIDETQQAGQPVSLFSLISVDCDVAPDNVAQVDPRAWARRLGATLDRIIQARGLDGSGWAMAFLDCEYQQAERVFRFHWHGFATGSQLSAIDLLRETRNYRSPRPREGQDRSPVRHRVHLTRQPLEDLRCVCIYPIKPQWQCRTVPSNQEGNRERTWPQPLPSRLQAIERLFFDRWSLQDLSMTRVLRVIDRRLHKTRPGS